MSKLYSQWAHLALEYRHLWHHWYEDNAEVTLNELLERGLQASEIGTLDAPYIKELLDKWSDHVYAQYQHVPA